MDEWMKPNTEAFIHIRPTSMSRPKNTTSKQNPLIQRVTCNINMILSLIPIPSGNYFCIIKAYYFEGSIFLLSGIKKNCTSDPFFYLNSKGKSSNGILIDVKDCMVLIHSSYDNLCSFLFCKRLHFLLVATWFSSLDCPLSWFHLDLIFDLGLFTSPISYHESILFLAFDLSFLISRH